MVREDLINSAVTFLQDPSVASAPLDKRIAFLNSKNLTQDEVNLALARAGSANTSVAPNTQQNYAYQGVPQAPPGYGQYPGYWQPPPPEVPKRDWRDWFIMATVVGGVGFGLYVTAQRYILPLIKPPTPPQLTQDKESVDESFNKAFGLLEQLEADTKVLKEAEESRTTKLDTALTELETVVASLKESDRKREDDARRNTDEIRMLRDLIPKALESEKSTTENRLKDLTSELKSLKTLLGNRLGSTTTSSAVNHRPTGSFGNAIPSVNGTSSIARSATPPSTSTTPAPPEQSAASNDGASTSAATGPSTSPKPSSTSTFSRFGSSKAAIPAWQKAAAQNNAEASKTDTSNSGTVTEEVVAQ